MQGTSPHCTSLFFFVCLSFIVVYVELCILLYPYISCYLVIILLLLIIF